MQILDPPGPMTGLWSFPGSGNTWMRHLIQLSTGYVTGSEYLENSNGEFPGEHISNGSAIVIKSHLLRENANMYDRAILIIRNPLDSFIAESNRMLTGNPSLLSNAPIDKLIEFIDGFVNINTLYLSLLVCQMERYESRGRNHMGSNFCLSRTLPQMLTPKMIAVTTITPILEGSLTR